MRFSLRQKKERWDHFLVSLQLEKIPIGKTSLLKFIFLKLPKSNCSAVGCIVSPQKMLKSCSLVSVNVTLLEISFSRYNQVRMGSDWIKVGPQCNYWCSCKEREIWQHRHTQREDRLVRTVAETGMKQLQAKNANHCHQKLEEARKGFFPWAFRGNMALLTHWFRSSGLQD